MVSLLWDTFFIDDVDHSDTFLTRQIVMPHIILTLPTTNCATDNAIALSSFRRNIGNRLITTHFNVDHGLQVIAESPDGDEILKAVTLLTEELNCAYIESMIHYRIEDDKVSKYSVFEN